MLTAAIPRVLQDVGAGAAALTAVVLFVGLVWKSRPMRWLWRTLIAEPFAAWTRAQVEHVVEPRIAEVRAELRPNGGSSFRDQVTRIEGRLVDGDERMDRLESVVDKLAERYLDSDESIGD